MGKTERDPFGALWLLREISFDGEYVTTGECEVGAVTLWVAKGYAPGALRRPARGQYLNQPLKKKLKKTKKRFRLNCRWRTMLI